MIRDFTHAFRLLKKNPITTAVMILALGLGIGANTASFIGVNALLLRPFPYPNLDRIVTLWQTVPRLGLQRSGLVPADFADFEKENRSFEQLAAYRRWTTNITGGDRPLPIEGTRVTPGFFQVFGTVPQLGRTFTDNEGESGNNRVAILSDRLWRTRFAGMSDIVGREISLGGQNHTIVGIMPDEFNYPLGAELWVPLSWEPSDRVTRNPNVPHDLLALGLLRPEVSLDQGRVDIAAVAKRLEGEYPETNAGWSAGIAPLTQTIDEVTGRFVTILAIGALFLLLLAAANVANIQLARATGRVKAIAIEAALGASRFRIARALCAESILLAVAGGVFGLAFAVWVNDLNRSLIPVQVYQWVPGISNLRVDSTVILFTMSVSAVTAVLCSVPAMAQLLRWHSSPVLMEGLSHNGRTVAGDLRSGLRNGLVVCEVAVALLLLVGAGVMVNTFQRILTLNLGYNPSNLLTAEVSLPRRDYSQNAQITSFFDRLLAEISVMANVRSVSVQGEMGRPADFLIEGRPEPASNEPRPNVRIVDAGYFQTNEIPIIRGRAIADQDAQGSLPVAIVSMSLAEHYWRGSNPVGQRIRFGSSPWLTVVGVSGNTMDWFFNVAQFAVYVPYRQTPVPNVTLLVRTEGDPLRATNSVVASIRGLDPAEPVYQIKTEEQRLSEERSGVLASARIMSLNAVIALFLAVTGIYGVLSYFVTQRTKEVGVRIALGAATSDILMMTLRHAGRLAGIGLLIGVPTTYALTRILSSALFNVVVMKWTTFTFLTFLLALAALLAAYVPARRAAAVDPVIALRND
jgi:putative ABC transport system permease protein